MGDPNKLSLSEEEKALFTKIRTILRSMDDGQYHRILDHLGWSRPWRYVPRSARDKSASALGGDNKRLALVTVESGSGWTSSSTSARGQTPDADRKQAHCPWLGRTHVAGRREDGKVLFQTIESEGDIIDSFTANPECWCCRIKRDSKGIVVFPTFD